MTPRREERLCLRSGDQQEQDVVVATVIAVEQLVPVLAKMPFGMVIQDVAQDVIKELFTYYRIST